MAVNDNKESMHGGGKRSAVRGKTLQNYRRKGGSKIARKKLCAYVDL